MYIEREIENTLESRLQQSKVILVTGARQVGKTTLLKKRLSKGYRYVTLDDIRVLNLAQTDPFLFFEAHQPPIIIDEIQQAPELFRQVKFLVDQSNTKGTIVLTGSQTYHLMKGVSESLAGRISILEMSGLSLREILDLRGRNPYIPQPSTPTALTFTPQGGKLWNHIQRGSMPELQDPSIEGDSYYADYVRTYLERDVRELIHVKDELKFYHFLVACAARTGQLLNTSDIAQTVGVSVKTIQNWLSVLQASGIIHILQPLWANTRKRLTKTPKLFFLDTGLACHLTGWINADVLQRGALAGHIFETFVVSEILKSYLNAGVSTRNIFFYRDSQKREIDLIIKNGHLLHPIEIKLNATPTKETIKNFKVLDDINEFARGAGSVICQTDTPFLLAENVQALSVYHI